MATGIIKLANKLPRINPPLTTPGGDPNPYCYPNYPYVEGQKDVSTTFCQAAQNLAEWLYIYRKPTGKLYLYLEIDELNGACYFTNFPTGIIGEPGVYLVENTTGSLITYTRLMSADSYFIPDPFFKTVAVGLLPNASGVTLGWGRGNGPNVTKDNNGRIKLDCNNSPGQVAVVYKMDMPDATITDVEVTIDYIPPGGAIRLAYFGGGTLNEYTSPGIYKERVQWNIGKPVCLTNGAQFQGEVIVSRFSAKAQGQTWTAEGMFRCKLGALWVAQSDLFDAVVNPAIITASNQIEHPDFAGQADPMLGFNGYAPIAGMYKAGDTVYNRNAASGQPVGWRCISPGNPGTWAQLPTL